MSVDIPTAKETRENFKREQIRQIIVRMDYAHRNGHRNIRINFSSEFKCDGLTECSEKLPELMEIFKEMDKKGYEVSYNFGKSHEFEGHISW